MKVPPARATVGLIVVTSAVSLLVLSSGQGDRAALLAGFVPVRFGGITWLPDAVPAVLTPFTSALLHGGALHLFFNMLMLGFCGKLAEAALGARGLLVLYAIGAVVAAIAQWLAGPTSPVPMIGASGAVSAVVGAYAMLYGQGRARAIGPVSARMVNILWLAAAWIGLQLLMGIAGRSMAGGGLAIAAHIGGFLAGLVLSRPLLLWRYRRA